MSNKLTACLYSSFLSSIDGTFSKGKGRYINDGCGGNQNSYIQLVIVRGRPHLAVFAKRNIKAGEEIVYDYGVPSLPWRKHVSVDIILLT